MRETPFRAVIVAATLAAAFGCASAEPVDPAEARCRTLAASLQVPELATRIERREDLPAFCAVTGRIEGRVGFETRLPLEGWNGKLLVAGCGGFCGSLLPDKPGHSNAINEALRRGYAATAHDGGHQAPSWDTAWAHGDPRALALWAHEVLPVVTETSAALVADYYGRAAERRYYSGCSNGGRLGLMAAQRHPELFDAIAAGGSILDVTGNAAIHGAWLLRSAGGAPRVLPWSAAQVDALRRHVLERCDSADGLTDGIVGDPPGCRPEPAELSCGAAPEPGCLSPEQVAFAEAMYAGVRNAAGEPLFAPIAPGSEAFWPRWLLGADETPGWGQLAAQGQLDLSHAVAPGRSYDARGFDFERDPARLRREPVAATIDAVDPDLRPFAAAGGRLFLWHGWADPLILPGRTVAYHEAATKMLGGSEAAAETLRLFMVPGHGHCWERLADAPDRFDPLQVLERWVEDGEAPDRIVAEQWDTAGRVTRTRPLCTWPARAVWNGGDPAVAASFDCRAP